VTEREQLPWQAWRRCLNRAVRDQQAETLLYGEVQGDLRLRLGLVDYLGYSRGLPCSADQLLITQGAQQGLDLLARVRLAPGDCVAMEEPGYPPARAVFEAVGAKVIPVPVDEEGLCVDRIPDQARLVYLTPSHQFPLGMPMSLSRRLALLERARATEMLIVEDDYDGEFRFEGRPLEALKRLDHHQQVAYLGSFSKVLHASFRMGYIVMPGGLQAALLQAKSLTDSSSNDLTQRALGYLMLAALRRQSALTVLPQMAGLHIAVRTPPVRDLADALNREGVTAMSLESLYMAEPAMPGVLLGFGALPDDTIEDGVSALTRALAR
jgi:GntR family transcriptional regulator/MocR family aminotransferase